MRSKNVPVDWNELRRQIESARAAADRAWTPGPEEVERVLRARAESLAREPQKAQAADMLELVEFILAQEKYAVESRHVGEVYPLEDLTPVPCTPAFVLGIVNLRREIVSVLDIKKFFDLPEKGLTDLNKVIVLHSDNMRFGILADAILGIRRVPLSEIQPSLPTLTGIREKYLKGVTAERTVVLDAEKLLGDETIIVQEQVEGDYA
jgi:purine-binding chemotaxis protein CheW